MPERLTARDISKFEAVDNLLRGAITGYQNGEYGIERLFEKIKTLHGEFVNVIEKTGEIGLGLTSRLQDALEAICHGRDEFVSRAPNSYHQIVYETHRLLVNSLKGPKLSYYGALFVGWRDKKEIPAEVRPVVKMFRKSALMPHKETAFLKTEAGWVMYVSAGGNPVHFNMVKKIGNKLYATLSDFIRARIEVVRHVLERRGFKEVALYLIPKTVVLRGGTIDAYNNYLVDVEGDVAQLGTLAKVLFRSLSVGLVEVNTTNANEKEDREKLVIEHLLERYIENPQPMTKITVLGADICSSTLKDALGKCQKDDVPRILDELLQMDVKTYVRALRQKYGLKS